MGKLMMLSYAWIPLSFLLIQSSNAETRLNDVSILVVEQENNSLAPQSTGTEKERTDVPVDALFLSLNGVRYEAIQWGKMRGLAQNGGYVVALDEKTGKKKWLVQVYKVHYDPDKELDKQDVFIRKITLKENKKSLRIENDRGEQYVLNLRTHTVKKLTP